MEDRLARGCARCASRRAARLDARLGWYIILGTIPIAVLGLVFKDQIENGARTLYLIGIALIALLVRDALRRARLAERDREIESSRAATA